MIRITKSTLSSKDTNRHIQEILRSTHAAMISKNRFHDGESFVLSNTQKMTNPKFENYSTFKTKQLDKSNDIKSAIIQNRVRPSVLLPILDLGV